MADDDDWETDADFENTMTETERRRAGSVEHLAQQRAQSGQQSLETIRQRAMSLHEQANLQERASTKSAPSDADAQAQRKAEAQAQAEAEAQRRAAEVQAQRKAEAGEDLTKKESAAFLSEARRKAEAGEELTK